jgi:hypothetical protein
MADMAKTHIRKFLRNSPSFLRPSRALWPRPSGLDIGTEKDWDQSFLHPR